MLCENRAIELLRQHCLDLESSRWVGEALPYGDRWIKTIVTEVEVHVNASTRNWAAPRPADDGASLRLALDVVCAISQCWGFEPRVNPGFWRRAGEEVFNKGETCGISIALSNEAFVRVALSCSLQPVHCAPFWFGLFHSDASHRTVYHQVMEMLSPHLIPGYRPLQLILSKCATRAGWGGEGKRSEVVPVEALKPVIRAAAFPGDNIVPIAIVMEYCIDDDGIGTSEILGILELARPMPHLTIERLVLQLTPRSRCHLPPRGIDIDADSFSLTRMLRTLGELLRRVFLTDGAAHKIRLLVVTWCHRRDYRLIGAALSVVPVAKALEELRCEDIDRGDGERLFRLAWLLASGLPLRDVVGEALRSRYGDPSRLNVDCLPMGSVVTLKRGCLLFSQPGRDTHDYVLSVVVGDETVDAVAYLVDEGFIGVVYAGFGLAWVVDSSVLWPPIDSSMSDEEDGAEAEHPLRQAHLSSLALDIEYGAEFRFPPEPLRLRSFVDVFLSILAAPTLVHLTLTRAELSREDLVALSRVFPMLQSLQLTRVLLQTLEPIVKAFATTTNQISTLVLANISPAPPLENDDQSAHIYQSLLDALAEPGHNIRKSLRELTLDFHATEDPEYPFVTETNRNGRILRSLVAILQLRDLRLKSLRVLMHNGPLDLPPVVGHVQDRVLPDPPRICCAVLSVLRVKHCEAAEVKALVLVMVRGSIVRTITWRDYAFY